MNQHIEAIYDNGVFRPLVPLALPNQALVKLTVEEEPTAALSAAPEPGVPDVDVLAKQRAALEQMQRTIKELPQHRNNDGWSVRQHDEIHYGWHK